MAVLNATTMLEIDRAYLPEDINIPIGFHGSWVNHKVDKYNQAYSSSSFMLRISLTIISITLYTIL